MPGTIAILQTVLSIQSADHKLVVLILGGREQLLIWRLFYSKAAVITAPEFWNYFVPVLWETFKEKIQEKN